MLPGKSLQVTITKWYETFDVTARESRFYRTNGDADFLGKPALYWLITGVEFDPITIDGWFGFQVTYQLEGNPDLWHPLMILDSGWNRFDAAGNPVKGEDGYGQRLQYPVLLAADGERLDPANPPRFKSFKVYESLNFSSFLL